MVTREQVVWGYRVLLEREPESESVIAEKMNSDSLHVLVRDITQSTEFLQKHALGGSGVVNRWVMVEHELGFRIWVNLADLAVSWAIIKNEFERPEVSFVQSSIRPGNTVLDVGTNLGFFALLFSNLVGASGRVVGFEPLTFLFDAVTKSVNENGFGQCSVFNVALGAKRGSAELIYAPDSTNWGGAFLSFDGQGLPGHRSVPVPVAPLSDFVDGVKADFMKIDVEGAEHLVIGACLDYLAECRPLVMSEIHCGQLQRVSGASPKEYIDLMGSIGYSCREIEPSGNLGKRVRGDERFELVNVAFVFG